MSVLQETAVCSTTPQLAIPRDYDVPSVDSAGGVPAASAGLQGGEECRAQASGIALFDMHGRLRA